MKIGILGGTFDPPHIGHLIVAQDAAAALGLDRVLFIPAASPPHKERAVRTLAEQRARMVELAIADDPRFAMDRLELERAGPSWTIDTLRELTAREPETEWILLMGADQYAEFEKWRDPAGIRKLARIAVMRRGDSIPTPLASADIAIRVTRIDVSATEVRHRVASGLPIRYLVPRAVEDYIAENRLYPGNGTRATGYQHE